MNDYRILINKEKKSVTFQGINWGYGLGSTLLLWDYHQGRSLIVVKKPGASDWSSRGESSYGPAEFMILHITEKIGAGGVQAEEIISFPIRKPRSES